MNERANQQSGSNGSKSVAHEPDAEVVSWLASPGGKGALRLDGDAYVGEDGTRYALEDGVLRTLREVDPALAIEIAAQATAAADYADPSLLMPRYEHAVARMAIATAQGGIPRGARVLDLGCGIGLVGRLYPEIGLVGVDVSMPLLSKAKIGYRMLIEASAEKLPFRDQTFDAVLTINMLHHVVTPEAAMGEVARVLKKGGILLSVDPRKVAPVELAKWVLRRNDPTFAPTHKAFTVEEYETILRAGGAMEIEELQRIGLISLLGMGGLDATRLSRAITNGDRVARVLTQMDELLFKVPGVWHAGLNLNARARRT